MDLGRKIKTLRFRNGLTQEQLAQPLGVTAQAVSKWEHGSAMPDITLLPRIAEQFGVTIDELFDLTREEKLRRMESRIENNSSLPTELFCEYESYLYAELENQKNDPYPFHAMLAKLYHHRMQSDAQKVSTYARLAIQAHPERKECQWLLQQAEGQAPWDWNVANHHRQIDFYRSILENTAVPSASALSYYYLLDQLIADHRVKEATVWLEKLKRHPVHKPFMIPVYEAHIALAKYDEAQADETMEKAIKTYGEDAGFLFEAAQYYARKCDYEKAILFYEASYEKEKGLKPRYTDALEGIAVLYEIMGENRKASAVYDRMIENLKNEWGFSEDMPAVQDALKERDRLLRK